MGTISDKLTYLNTTKGKIKDAINLTGANILSEDTFRSYADKLKQGLVDAINDGGSTIYSNFPKTTGEGTEIALNDTYEAPMEIGLKGNTEQTTYTGKNLFKPFDFTKTSNGITFTYNNDGSININGTSTGNALSMYSNEAIPYLITLQPGIYTISGEIGNVRIEVVNSTGQTIGNTSTQRTFEITSATQVFIRLNIGTGFTFNNAKVYPQLEAGSQATSYEPYVGGPSPNPDYPQDIKVVTGDNTINIRGKNLAKSFVNGDSLYRYSHSLYVDADFEVGKKYAISFVDKSVGNSYYRNEYLMQNIPSYSITATGERQTYYFECKSNDKTNSNLYVEGKGFDIFKNNAVLEQLPQFEDVQIEEVESYDIPSTPYVPYQSQTYSLNLGSIELCKIGDYQDYIYKDNGKWYKYGAIRKYTTGVSATILSNGTCRIKLKDISNLHDITSSTNIYVPSLSKNAIIRNQTGYSAPRYNQGWGGLAMAYSADVASQIGEFETTQQLLNWFNNNEEVYIAINPTYDYIDITEITDTDLIEQLEELEKAKSVDDKTFISQINADLPFIISASALSKN